MLGSLALFAGGALFGSAGLKLLSGKDAKKVYTHVTAAVLRGKDDVMECVTKVRENAGDIYEDAKEINRERAEAENEIIEDADFREEKTIPAKKRGTAKRTGSKKGAKKK